ncbi:nicotinate-nucleotide--dimethylbenzimidazole phosphoribosyltransferase [Thiocapsa imhoffii]|uniref:Nicotinate-nucleotide--dimethylbenzimidazole phosphoribosyltransferase n=1 Tax=Thiocapsa imhoffii TaxID=382777 RepID=A0A9X1B7P1_9GAMM|nr:nicotinate-nucleotide--dimethylbenzimidazole phosphoribosyltransferase [Thiocapsa imhoffii]MBK1643116.1 nicotinate-nucleotide--dimethylbenzimidazole phosphoribosyltransferase [Thiocapsa imhoffii]
MSESLSWLTQPCLPIDAMAADAARRRQDHLTKPRGSLGRLEELAIRLAGLQGTPNPTSDPVQILLFAADHGVAAEGVSAFPQAVTVQMVRNIAAGGAAIAVLAQALDARLEILDVGMATDPGPIPGVRPERIGPGTANLARAPAMTDAQLAAAMNTGRAAAERALDGGARLLICGEMGIGNTTPATALTCALLDQPAEVIVGPGTGLSPEGVAHKADIITRALALHASEGSTPTELLARLGGFEIAAMVGALITAAQRGLPILVDGFIVSAAALVAARLQPELRHWLLFSHQSAEPGHQQIIAALEGDPLLDLGMRLGEGSGAAVAVPLLRLACALHQQMATFAEAGVSEADGALD